jgi:hypothetical protein
MSSTKLRCRVGMHRWERRRNKESGVPYLECGDCGKQKDTMTLNDHLGSSGGGAI